MGGHAGTVRCSNCSRCVPKDKAIKRFQVRNMVDASSQRDIKDASCYSTFMLPKLFLKMQMCVSCAIHGRIVRVRNKVLRASPEGRIYARPNFGGKGEGKGASRLPGRRCENQESGGAGNSTVTERGSWCSS